MKKLSNSMAQWVWLAAAVTVMVLASSVELLDGVQVKDHQAQQASESKSKSLVSAGALGLGDLLNLQPQIGYAIQEPPGKVEPR
jgi:hypothetical protein